ncbi:swr complex subunit [Lobaria immixta]|nr:swr complex subunit [Lobaria immixta]
MTTADVRDMLDLPSDGQPRPVKKQKTVEKRPEGITRELYALLGERAPPVAITEHIRLKEKPKWPHKVQPWEITPFGNPARNDGLMLKHWRKRRDPNTGAFPATPAESNAASELEQDEKIVKTEPDYHYAKFNVRLDKPKYTQEQYEQHLMSEGWDKPETDYLVSLVHEYDIRWILIGDRYDYQPPEERAEGDHSMGVVMQAKKRTMEDMKARYYEVAAKTMALHRPLANMSTDEFGLHEKMTKFDAALEATRKKLAEALISRTPEEVKEEEMLLGELKRIVTNEERFSQERKELYDRLESPPSSSSNTMYHSSHELYQLMQTLLDADKNKKRRSLMEGSSNSASGNSAQIFPDRNHRQSVSSAQDKRGSLSSLSGQRQLSARDELKYGVSHHERLSAGVQFRHEKITKLSQAKSNVQATKISAALTELKIPQRLVMPTAKVVSEYERLIQSIHNLLEIRKVSEKLEAEIKVLQAQREDEGGRENGHPSTAPPFGQVPIEVTNMGDVGDSDAEDRGAEEDEEDDEVEDAKDEKDEAEKDEDEDKNGDYDEDDDDDDDEGEENKRPSTRASAAPSVRSVRSSGTRKRSASVMSVVSNKSSKKQRK